VAHAPLVSFKFNPPARILISLPAACVLLIIADTQDTSGGGRDSVGKVRALSRNGAKGAAVGQIGDARASREQATRWALVLELESSSAIACFMFSRQ